MSKAIYSLKAWMFREQFTLTAKEEQGLRSVSIFIARMYTKAWTEAPLASAAPRNDLALLQELNAYITVNRTVAKAALTKIEVEPSMLPLRKARRPRPIRRECLHRHKTTNARSHAAGREQKRRVSIKAASASDKRYRRATA